MPLTLPGTGIALTRANFAEVVKTFVDNLETSINSVSTTANSALSTANAKYAKPAQGIPAADLAADAKAGNVLGTPSNKITDKTYRNATLTTNTYQLTAADFASSVAQIGDENYQTD